MSTAEIIAELAHLGPADLAAIRAWLDRHAASSAAPPKPTRASPVRLRSPRLADPAHAGDLVKQVIKPDADAAV